MTRVQAGLLLLLAVPVLWGLFWLGWRGRARRQSGVGELPDVPPDFEVSIGPVEATYVSTTSAGDWLDRVVAHGLGVRSAASVAIGRAGLLLERRGAPDVWVPTSSLRGVRRERGMVGKVVEPGGLVVVTWSHGDLSFDTGLRLRHAADRELVVNALTGVTA